MTIVKGKPLKPESTNREPAVQRLGQSAEFVRELERLAELAPAEHGIELRRIVRSA